MQLQPRRSSCLQRRALGFERLGERILLTAQPYGAMPDDTGELFVGDVHVTVVLMESNNQLSSVNDNSEDWTPSAIAAVKTRVAEGLQWWRDALANITDKHQLDFHIDYTFADQPVSTRYEPITRRSTDFQFWIYDFLNSVGHNQTGNFSSDIRSFNHAQRVASESDWAFTIFVVNDENDVDGQFAPGGFSRAFAFSGGRFFVMPAGRPATTVAHEVGHMFWARDEYFGGGTYSSFRGYYNTQNLNAADNPTPGFQQVPSIMETGDCQSGGGLLCTAYQTHTSSPTSFEMIGWRDSDGDGVFDFADVPHTLDGSGYYDAATESYRFLGTSSVQTLPNLNSSGLQNDITLNVISRAEYRIDGGSWQTAEVIDQPTAALDLTIPIAATASTIEIRTIDETTGVTSPVFQGSMNSPASTAHSGIQGFVWRDLNEDGQWSSGEPSLSGWTVELVDSGGTVLDLATLVEPDDFPGSDPINAVVAGVTLNAAGTQAPSSLVRTVNSSRASTGERVFGSVNASCGGVCSEWSPNRRLRINFQEAVGSVSIDAIGNRVNSYGRLEAYDAAGRLLSRTTSGGLADGEVETLTLTSAAQNIAYVVAYGHAESTVLLDNLVIGTAATATTDASGAYAFPYLDSGEYNVRVTPSGSLQPTDPDPAQTAVSYVVGSAVENVDFGFSVSTSPWQNANNLDVNNDGFVSPNDVLVIINDLNSSGPRELTGEVPPPFLDVTGDGNITSADALAIINFLNAPPADGESALPGGIPRREVAPAEGEAPVSLADVAPSAAIEGAHDRILAGAPEAEGPAAARDWFSPLDPAHQPPDDLLSLLAEEWKAV